MAIEDIMKIACERPVREKPRYLEREEAEKRYKDRKSEGEDTTIRGFHFTLDELKAFIADLEAYNEGKPMPDKVAGIRIWKAKSALNIDSEPKGDGDDVLLTPTLSNETDIHATKAGDGCVDSKGNLLILSSARPCPNLCGPGGPKFFYEYEH